MRYSELNEKSRSILCWIFAFAFTMAMARFQRTTGPTYALTGDSRIGTTALAYKLERSHALVKNQPDRWDMPVEIVMIDKSITGSVLWKRHRYAEDFHCLPLSRSGDTLRAFLPHQPPAGKLEYKILLWNTRNDDQIYHIPPGGPVVMRFRGDVPMWAMLPHIILLFLGLLLATRVALAALFGGRIERLLWLVFGLFVVGGLVFGPIVQKYAFGAYWTGWPLGDDWTDNKTALMVAAWLPALWFIRRQRDRRARVWTIAAMVVTFAVYMIPHSLGGSELDYNIMNQDSLRLSEKTNQNSTWVDSTMVNTE